MVTPLERLAACVGFQWDAGNAAKNRDKHDVSQSECEQVFFNRPLLVKHDAAHSRHECRYYALGRTDRNRFLLVVLTIRQDRIRVISTRDMTPSERRKYPL
ncbi:MAG: BrnT family toxin [Phycisphaerales bacterium]